MKITAKVTATKYHGTSTMGNPTYYVTLEERDGTTGIYRTQSNASIAYAIENREYRDEWHEYLITTAGRIRCAMKIKEEK